MVKRDGEKTSFLREGAQRIRGQLATWAARGDGTGQEGAAGVLSERCNKDRGRDVGEFGRWARPFQARAGLFMRARPV
jgi:hypothetical protein